MKYAILADIHANLEALHAVLRDQELQGCNRAVCLGDLVGYGHRPKECVDIIRGLGIPCVKGNFDQYCSDLEPLDGFASHTLEHVLWTRAQLSEEDRSWLRNLKLVDEVEGFTIVHATLDEPSRWAYVFDKLMAAASFWYQTTPVCLFGHTHVPVAFVKDSAVRGGLYSVFKVEKGCRYFVNPGSVGQPRDGNPKAAYAIYDLASGIIELRRLDYRRPPDEGGAGEPTIPYRPVNPQLGSSIESPS